MRRELISLTFAALLASAALAQTEDLTIEKGFDLFRTLPDQESVQSFSDCPVPGLSFESASDTVLTGCEPFGGDVRLQGSQLGTFRGFAVGLIDTIVERKATLDFGMPEETTTLVTPIELAALSLVSVGPIGVQCDQGLTRWQVFVEVDPTTGPSAGQMAVTLDHPALTGGTASSELEICPRVTFVRIDGGGEGTFEIHPCTLLCGPQLTGETQWAFEQPAGEEVLKIEGLTTPNFFFLQPEDVPGCECGFLYPHLSETHTHQACAPCPCDADIVAPTLETPAPETFECTGKNLDGVGGIPATDSFIAGWLSSAACADATSEIDFCGPVTPPSFFPLGPPEDPPAHCVGETPVRFRAQDECDNETDRTVPLKVQDTGIPLVTAGSGDFDCLAPPAGGLHCYSQEDGPFAFETIRQGFTSDLCSEIEDWWFVDCASDQPDDGRADGNTGHDCTVATDRKSFCVRSERAAQIDAGRRYSVEIQARDVCGNVSQPEVIGFVHVPHDPPADRTCTQVPSCKPECLAEPTTGEVPLAVGFSSKSTCPIESWEWDFGDGTTSQQAVAVDHTYLAGGTFTPKLTAKVEGVDEPFVVGCPDVTVDPRPDPPGEPNPEDCFVELGVGGGNRLETIDVAAQLGIGGTVTVTDVCQDEPVTGSGRGNREPDAVISGGVAQVRNQSDGQGDGRVYHVAFEVDGQAPAFCGGGVIEVCVPHDNSGAGCVDGGALLDSTQVGSVPCPRSLP